MSILRGVCPSNASSLRAATLSRSCRETVTGPAIVERPTGNTVNDKIPTICICHLWARHFSRFKFVSGSSRFTNLSKIQRILGSQIAERDSDTRRQPQCRGQGRPPGQRGILIRRAESGPATCRSPAADSDRPSSEAQFPDRG